MAAISSIQLLNRKRQELGMTYAVLAARSGVSLPTVQRVLAGGQSSASFANVVAIADAMGVDVRFEPSTEAEELLEWQAQQKAERLVGMVQGSSALEGQAVDRDTLDQMIRRTVHELLAGSKRRLWAR